MYGIAVEKEYINKKSAEELELGIIKEETLNSFIEVKEIMKSEFNIKALIMGCRIAIII